MYIAMNRFKVAPGAETEFEHVLTSRDTHLRGVPGFVEFHLLRGPQKDDHVLYSSHTVWSDHTAFETWTRSEAFRAAHRKRRQRRRRTRGPALDDEPPRLLAIRILSSDFARGPETCCTSICGCQYLAASRASHSHSLEQPYTQFGANVSPRR